MMRAILIVGLAILSLSPDAMAWGWKKKPAQPGTWSEASDGKPGCYNPPDWEVLSLIDRKMKRSEVMDEMLGQWRGDRKDGVSFDEKLIDKMDTVLLGRPEKIEAVAAENYVLCQKGDTAAWGQWVAGQPSKLTEGECNTNFDYTLFDHLDIQSGWQGRRPICQGNKIVLKASSMDRYKISDDGPWITVTGDPALPTAGNSDWPCNLEGCLAGVLMLRFTGQSGMSSLYVAGQLIRFSAPEHGHIDYRINDTQFFDNKWFEARGVIDHTSIEISPSR
jgi:hypothetical protein